MLRVRYERLRRFRRYYFFTTLFALLPLSMLLAQGPGLSDDLLRRVQEEYGWRAHRTLVQWQELIEGSSDQGDQEKLELVNRFFNSKIRFVDDIKHWGKEDYWATPIETMATRGGDCEDFSIAKYFTLLEMGIPDERMRLVYVRALRLKQPHMVLTYYPSPDADPLVLDNVIDDIRPASERKDLVPVYSFNGKGLWIAKARGRGKLVGSSRRISLWKDLGLRMMREGFAK